MTSFKIFENCLDKIANLKKTFGTYAMAFIIIINIYGILSRYVLKTPVIYVQELTILAGIWIFFIGMSLVLKSDSDIVVGFLVQRCSKRFQLINEIFVDVIILFFSIVTAWETWKFLPYTRTEVPVMSFALGLPDEFFFYPIGIGALSSFLIVFQKLIRHIISFHSRWEKSTTEERG
jgi:TRAP-type C4-dicarboxylate transport system permease small subunit